MEKEAMEFAKWASHAYWYWSTYPFNEDDDGLWYNQYFNKNEGKTTEQLYEMYKKEKEEVK